MRAAVRQLQLRVADLQDDPRLRRRSRRAATAARRRCCRPRRAACRRPRTWPPTRLVIVVLPLLPVMPTTGPGQSSRNSRIMELRGTCRSRAAVSAGMSSGTLCETKTMSAPTVSAGSLAPRERRTGSPSSSSQAGSQTVGRPGVADGDLRALAHQEAHQVDPLDAQPHHRHLLAPKVWFMCHSILTNPTALMLYLRSPPTMPISQNLVTTCGSDQPEQLEMMVQRRHPEDAPSPRQAEVGDLDRRR